VVGIDFHAGFGVGIGSWLEAELGHAEFGEEGADYAHEHGQGRSLLSDDSFDLAELGQMGSVEGFVSENFVDAEVPTKKKTDCEKVRKRDQ
jgi:hypothetical protein